MEELASDACMDGPADARPALYDSRVVPGADEIGLAIPVAHGDRGEPVDGCEERSVKEIRAKLGRLGIPEQ